MLKDVLISLAMLISNNGAETRARNAVDAVVKITADFDATELYPEYKDNPNAAREKLGKLLISWSYWESSWQHQALGDGGRSCGIMQVMPKTGGMTCSQMRSTPEAGFRAGLGVIRSLNKLCGGLRPALGAYASGRCGGAGKIIENRCKKSGGC